MTGNLSMCFSSIMQSKAFFDTSDYLKMIRASNICPELRRALPDENIRFRWPVASHTCGRRMFTVFSLSSGIATHATAVPPNICRCLWIFCLCMRAVAMRNADAFRLLSGSHHEAQANRHHALIEHIPDVVRRCVPRSAP